MVLQLLQQALAQRPQSTRQMLPPAASCCLLLPAPASPTAPPACCSPWQPCRQQQRQKKSQQQTSRGGAGRGTRLMSIRAAAAAGCQSPWRLHWRSSATRFMPGSGQNVDGVDGKRCTCCRLILNVLATVEWAEGQCQLEQQQQGL